jgi:type IV pilus assembly protein PilA
MSKHARGFTLIEMMIVVAIIALLSAIALPMYRQYQARAAEKACLAETKTYANFVVAALANDDDLPAPSVRACSATDTATASSASITGTPKLPGTRRTTCDLATANCAVEP